MRHFNALGLGLVALAGFGACSDGGNTTAPVGKQVKLNVAPLSLPGIGNACYDYELRTSFGELVTSQGDHTTSAPTVAAATGEGALCSGQYGNGVGGDIAYVTPCDATDPGDHTVTLWVENLYQDPAGTTVLPDFVNPCKPGTEGCSLSFHCQENADVPVTFNLVIMRDANQGFFDIAVNFANVFCSAKLDTCTADGKDDNLLFTWPTGSGAGAGKRTKTAVLAFACSGGTGNQGNGNTTLYMNDVNLTCNGNTQMLDPHLPEGNQFDNKTDDVDNGLLHGGLIQWAIYRGDEALSCPNDFGGGSSDCHKMYWSIAMALDGNNANATNCTVKTEFSVGGQDDPAITFGAGPGPNDGWSTPDNARYPYLSVDVNLTGPGHNWLDTAPATADLCVHQVVFDAGISAQYTPSAGGVFARHMFCNAFSETQGAGPVTPASRDCP